MHCCAAEQFFSEVMGLTQLSVERSRHALSKPSKLITSFIAARRVAKSSPCRNYKVEGDQELAALVVANVVVDLFQGFSVTVGSSRTPMAESAGAESRLTGVIAEMCAAALLCSRQRRVRARNALRSGFASKKPAMPRSRAQVVGATRCPGDDTVRGSQVCIAGRPAPMKEVGNPNFPIRECGANRA